MPTPPTPVPDVVEVTVPAGGRVLVVSDVHLGPSPTPASTSAAGELARVIDDWVGPGVVLLAGDVFELLSGPNLDVDIILAAHPRLKSALQAFVAEPGHRIVCLAGSHDGRLAWDDRQVGKLAAALHAEVALAAELVVETGRGSRRVRVEHGHQLDPQSAFRDPRDPNDTPFSHHVSTELLPGIAAGARKWLEGWPEVGDPLAFPSFVASRVAYRRVARHLRWLMIPFALAVALKIPVVLSLAERTGHRFGVGRAGHRGIFLAVAVLADLMILVGGLFFGSRRAWAAAVNMGFGARGRR
ncbi:MAG: metallophosphoesterase, partial [Acidimicrobiales bacterium]